MESEELWRAALHDFNNLMAGLQGVLDLSDPVLPFDPRTHTRLETILEDGKTLVAMARTLALGRLPQAGLASWGEWESGLRARLDPMGSLFGCPIDLADAGACLDPWPVPLLQDWAAAFTRQILPWAAPGPLRLEAEASTNAWILRWFTDAPLPPALLAAPPPDAPRNLPSFWLRAMVRHLNLDIEPQAGCIQIRMPRQAPGGPSLQES